jgi:anhydro-N-acetylmuramic acid kinase
MTDFYIGLMSGTSVDGIDAALVDFSQAPPTVMATHYIPYSPALREQILSLCKTGENEIQRLGELDIILGREFARAVNGMLQQQSISAQDVKAIGSHGQTVRHYPFQPYGFTLQIGDPNTIAAETGITTVADFRRKDVALGGQGAPLVPAFHRQILASNVMNRAIVNIGGIANITLLPKNNPSPVTGFDTGPGNTLMDGWIYDQQQESHDKNGAWASQGVIRPELLNILLADPYFKLAAPKSTGREYFNQTWLQRQLAKYGQPINPVDVQATLAELTARSIIDITKASLPPGEILICGGGTHNAFLMSRLRELAQPEFTVDSTSKYNLDPDWMEAMAFAWLARQTLNRQPGNLPSVTGAKLSAVLGGVYYAS